MSCLFLGGSFAACLLLLNLRIHRTSCDKRKVQQRGVAACKEIVSALLDGVIDPNKNYQVFVVDTLPSRSPSSM